LVDEKFTLVKTFKIKKNIGYSSRYEGVIPIFLIENHVLRKACKKRENVLKAPVVGPKSSLCKSIKISPFFENPYIF
jgi:hypothetical protein